MRTRKRSPVGVQVHVLFVLPFLWAFSAFFRDPAGLLMHLGTFALLLLAAWLTREGAIAQAAYDERKIARRPAFPRKIFGAAAMGLGLALGGISGLGLTAAVALGALGAALHLTAFGPDPLRNKGMEGVDEFQTERVARAVSEAQRHLAAMSDQISRLNDRALHDRVRAFADQVNPLLRRVENDPGQLGAARRYLGLYLEGAREATVKFTELYARAPDTSARADYVTLLDDLQRNFALRLETMESTDRQALDIEMEVLRERLAREGVRPETSPSFGAGSPDGAETALQKGPSNV